MNYQVVYDIQRVWYPGWWVFALGLLPISLGLTVILFGDTKLLDSIIERSRNQRVVMPILFCIFGLVGLGVGTINYSNFANLRSAAQNGSTEIVAGKVEQFVPMPYEGHAQETFIVSGHYFSYSDYDQTKGFNQSQSHGGPIREGLQVRITHVDGSIVKLEIAE